MTPPLTPEDAYRAMFRFLEGYYDRNGAPDELGALLGGMALDEDGRPMDLAAWSDWLAAIEQVTAG